MFLASAIIHLIEQSLFANDTIRQVYKLVVSNKVYVKQSDQLINVFAIVKL